MQARDQVKVGGVLYRLQPRKCGKAGCKCNIPGQEHGPYWYSYDGNSAAKYVGAKLPDHVLKHVELLRDNGPKLKALEKDILERIEKQKFALEKSQRELRAVQNLRSGEYVASEVLKSLGLGQFNGHAKE
jgi:hypothetical protein